MSLLDTHYHLDFLGGFDIQRAFLDRLWVRDVSIIAQTMTPTGFRTGLDSWLDVDDAESGLGSVHRWSLGLHPWEITSEQVADEHLAVFANQVERTRFIGEIGLDFSPRRLEVANAAFQRSVLADVLQLVMGAARDVSPAEPYVLSIHAVRSAGAVLSLLAELGGCGQTAVPVFHWFSGTSQELTALVRLGGYVSVNPRMLESKRGRAYIRQVPADRLLLESDLPSEPIIAHQNTTENSHVTGANTVTEANAVVLGRKHADELAESLRSTLAHISSLRECDMTAQVMANQARLYQ
ncbi:MAG: TatD family deoxyribonuclease [Actinomycetaceae bacterium]|nr:TatD family deoxyribonuclease [Actinomycetaceae bacterium]